MLDRYWYGKAGRMREAPVPIVDIESAKIGRVVPRTSR
jgi:bifunctional ADP-heptose synthase (sugar kinase/adenylyltransferase)